MEYILQASAKVNLFLDITGDLPGGFHAVDTLMQSVDLYDTLFLRPAPGIRIDCPGVAQEQNTAFRGGPGSFLQKAALRAASTRASKRASPLPLAWGGAALTPPGCSSR